MLDPTTILSALIGAVATIIGAVLLWLSKRSDKATQTLDLALKQLGDRVAAQDVKIAELTTRLEKSEQEHEVKDLQIRTLTGTNRDLSDLVGDYRSLYLNWAEYVDRGSEPPPPEPSWRVRADIAKIKKEASD